jgi:GT2 family glycosyltransferase
LEQRPSRLGAVACILYDNSPDSHEIPAAVLVYSYTHDSANPGLALPYQLALGQALERGFDWLMLLDQDTTPTEEYLDEVFTATQVFAEDASVVAIVPKLMQDGDVLSPHWPMKRPDTASFQHLSGIRKEKLQVYNSGSVLRVSAVAKVGGFPQDFPLDFLDHALYHQLQQKGGRIYLLHATLAHELGSKHADYVKDFRSSKRLHSIVSAESRYYWRFGTAKELFFHAIWRLRLGARMILGGEWRAALKLWKMTLFPARLSIFRRDVVPRIER